MPISTSPARRGLFVLPLLWLTGACAGTMAQPSPTYVLDATDGPLRYSLEGINNTIIEIPGGGEQKVENSTRAVIAVEYAAATDEGLPFTLVYESFEAEATGAPSPDPSEIVGVPIRGYITSDGGIEVTEGPESSNPALSPQALGQLMSGLSVPLPPGGDGSLESWDASRSTPVAGGLEGSTTVTATARFDDAPAGGESAGRVIVSEGTMKQFAAGTPPGAPGEVEITTDGTLTTTYVWDPARGVVVSAEQVLSNEGTVTVVAQGMVLPLTSTTRARFQLLED